ncbi:MAG: hypothetical protein ACRC2T_16270 [Thermoguttaceae bacterium]
MRTKNIYYVMIIALPILVTGLFFASGKQSQTQAKGKLGPVSMEELATVWGGGEGYGCRPLTDTTSCINNLSIPGSVYVDKNDPNYTQNVQNARNACPTGNKVKGVGDVADAGRPPQTTPPTINTRFLHAPTNKVCQNNVVVNINEYDTLHNLSPARAIKCVVALGNVSKTIATQSCSDP